MTEQSIGNRKETMTKIILAFPCMGKTYYAQNHPAKVLDLESSDYFFDKTGYEHLTSEEFKGIPNRKLKENGLADYLKAIDEAVKSGKYDYVFTAQNPEYRPRYHRTRLRRTLLKPLPTEQSEAIFKQRAKDRGNNDTWIEGTVKFLKPSPLSIFSEDELKQVYVHLVPSEYYVTDVLVKEFYK